MMPGKMQLSTVLLTRGFTKFQYVVTRFIPPLKKKRECLLLIRLFYEVCVKHFTQWRMMLQVNTEVCGGNPVLILACYWSLETLTKY
jgi:hypothetical protein